MLRVRLKPPGERELERWLTAQRDQPFAYPEVGATRLERLPSGYCHDRYQATLGDGQAVFAAAVTALRTWAAHTGSRVTVRPAQAVVKPGTTVVLVPRLAGVSVVAACRIVYVVDEPERFGFAYGTLPLHPARGEESFTVERSEGGTVRFAITSFSRPAGPLLQAVGPLARSMQRRATGRYLTALGRFVRDSHVFAGIDPVEEAGIESFPASDPPAWWAGRGIGDRERRHRGYYGS